MAQMIYLKNRNRLTEIESDLWLPRGVGERGNGLETGVW